MDTSEAVAAQSSTGQEEESGSKGAEEEGPEPEDSQASLDAGSQELFSSQEEGSQLQWMMLGEEQVAEEVPNATLRSQLSFLSTAERLQRIRKQPRITKELKIKKYRTAGRGKGSSTSRMQIAGTKARSGC